MRQKAEEHLKTEHFQQPLAESETHKGRVLLVLRPFGPATFLRELGAENTDIGRIPRMYDNDHFLLTAGHPASSH